MRSFTLVHNSIHFIMVQAISLLTLLRMLTEAQTSCNFGLGRIVYEKLPHQQLQGYDDDVVRDASPPMQVLTRCQDLCLRDRTAANNLVRTCSSFDFQPGKRLTLPNSLPAPFNSPSTSPSVAGAVEYDESVCFLSRELPRPEGLGALVNLPGHFLYSEVCLSSARIERECPNRKSVFDRITRKRFRPSGSKEYFVNNRTECEDKCLNEYSFVCRSISYDSTSRTCSLSRYTRRTHPEQYEDDPGFEYLENTCLSDRRCEGQLTFVREERGQMLTAFDSEIMINTTIEECQARCLSADTYFCRSLTYDPISKACVLSSEDSASLSDQEVATMTGTGYYYFEILCMALGANEVNPLSQRGEGEASPLLVDGRRRDILTAFQRYRNSRLSADFQTEITDRSLAECLDECLRQTSYRCRSTMYSERFRVCRLSRSDQKDGRLIYEPDYDYYESLSVMNETVFESSSSFVNRPEEFGEITGSSAVGDFAASSAVPAGSWPPGIVPEIQSDDPYYAGPWPAGSGISPGGLPGGSSTGLGILPGGNQLGNRPRCEPGREHDGFRQAATRMRLRRIYVKRYLVAPSLAQCERECQTARDFRCISFNFYRLPFFSNAIGGERENCELSDRSTRELDTSNPSFFETNGDYDFYERSQTSDCLDVSQVCNEDGMEFTLRTPEPFTGRIYTYGFYDRCFFRGTGGLTNVLRITGPRGFPDCGSQRHGDILTNIIVVQFSEMVQTARDKRYNLTCLYGGPGEAVVTSGYIGAGSGSPTPIEFLPAQNILDSRVRLLIMYQGRPTTTIAVGDPLTFKLESLQGYNLIADIFATNVIAKDPYTGKSVQLIDRFGCPVDDGIFPSLDRARSGEGLEAAFNAFKIPESNFLVFEATVKSCRGGCQPVFCNTNNVPGRGSGQSYGRKRRDSPAGFALNKPAWLSLSSSSSSSTMKPIEDTNEEELVMEMLRVYANRDEIPENTVSLQKLDICLSRVEYYSLITSLGIILLILIASSFVAGLCFRRYRLLHFKNAGADATAPHSMLSHNTYGQQRQRNLFHHTPSARNFAFINRAFDLRTPPESTVGDRQTELDFGEGEVADRAVSRKGQHKQQSRAFQDPSEPIYTEPSLFERSRSLRSVAAPDLRRVVHRTTAEQPAIKEVPDTESAAL
ncbi:uncharacterized protein LOC124191300 isoform X2 [Daphnia pulex]|uniref:uncharacterized protein LOC124191300 isoform X2 n=1 Tax=Daphnia pulex TaxID=6669 RepID=UPI001EDE4757|nr:uncharacterized protein LOC124191300 isoform X2 [Daphnia pulex]